MYTETLTSRIGLMSCLTASSLIRQELMLMPYELQAS